MATQTGVSFRIAHLSDLHLSRHPNVFGFNEARGLRAKLGILLNAAIGGDFGRLMGSYDMGALRALNRALQVIRASDRPFDAAIITGDLATTGLIQDLAVARMYVSGNTVAGGADISNHPYPFSSHPVCILPGNHDRYGDRWMRPVSAVFESGRTFGERWACTFPVHSSTRSVVNSFLLAQRDDAKLAIVAADFSFPAEAPPRSPWTYLGKGFANPAIISQMVEETRRLKADGCSVLWATHFPADDRPKDKSLELLGARKVVEAAVTEKVPLIFSGHTHHAQHQYQVTYNDKFSGILQINAGTSTATGMGQRVFHDVTLTIYPQSRVIRASVVPMVYLPMSDRPIRGGRHTNRGEFVPLVTRTIGRKGLGRS